MLTVIHKMNMCTITNDTINKFTYLHKCFDYLWQLWSIPEKFDSIKLFSTIFQADKIDIRPWVFWQIVVDPWRRPEEREVPWIPHVLPLWAAWKMTLLPICIKLSLSDNNLIYCTWHSIINKMCITLGFWHDNHELDSTPTAHPTGALTV